MTVRTLKEFGENIIENDKIYAKDTVTSLRTKRIIYVLMKIVQDFADRRKQVTDDNTVHTHCMLDE